MSRAVLFLLQTDSITVAYNASNCLYNENVYYVNSIKLMLNKKFNYTNIAYIITEYKQVMSKYT